MKSGVRIFIGFIALVVVTAIVIAFFRFNRGTGYDEFGHPPESKQVSKIAEVALGEQHQKESEPEPTSTLINEESAVLKPKTPEPSFAPTILEEDFEVLLLATGDENIDERKRAWREIGALSNKEKIYWLGRFATSDDEALRKATMKVTRGCFSMDTFQRRTKGIYKDMEARRAALGDGEEMVLVDMSSLPSKREAVQINNIVRNGLRDESTDVRQEAVLTASSFDLDTCHILYQYAMTSCSDDVRLAILRDAEYGDDDYKLRLQMAALDVGGEEVIKFAIEGIEKATGQHFENSADAFEWYEQNRDTTIELEIGEPEEE